MVDPDRLVCFTIDDLVLALPLEKVERVMPSVRLTPLPNAPQAVLGILDLRGKVIPVFDIRARFGKPWREISLGEQILIAAASKRTVAMVVDEARGVIDCEPGSITASVEVLPGLEHIRGVAKHASGMIVIQDIDRFLSIEEERQLDGALEGMERKNG
ncbi:MAG TPA: chemotaxis protein CheW [Deltaproteobacteria bacterium]|nr:MAG: hypothetical protein A2Z79_04225 [Deltaproteobacteria bacterium GWA2_55_82]OGQ64134.1 MAG: hypothetical protein A3I81_10610 [Deltaproteobacteria bacterium RIFCSPLOWO2_02_FULL_55_12]OIJ74586.1 MAG: hypothetical protein A2V21_310135 [Deltaproteobacteria bacterium GWC2_55_46]HBG46472.1 chemotaxis protein CheW [Deltaproteobacteria bacterium]HCY10684.1 chemotaxis protein CheW [Deltaproteobacteria bacterium]